MRPYVIKPHHLPYVSVLPGTKTEYDSQSTKESVQTVSSIMGQDWIANKCAQLDNPDPISHFTQIGARYIELYLQINHLSDDLLAVSNVEGFSEFVEELRNWREYANHRHTLNCAATFARGGNKILRFIPSGHQGKSPDFEMIVNGRRMLVECKLFSRRSESRVKWDSYSEKLLAGIIDKFSIESRSFRRIGIAVKNLKKLPDIESVFQALVKHIDIICNKNDLVGDDRRARAAAMENFFLKANHGVFNVIIDANYEESGLDQYRQIEAYCPVPDQEKSRLLNLKKKASKQIREFNQTNQQSIICIGIENVADIEMVKSVIKEYEQSRSKSGQNGYYVTMSTYAYNEEYTGPLDYIDAMFDNITQHGETVDFGGAGLIGSFPANMSGGQIQVFYNARTIGVKGDSEDFSIVIYTRDGVPKMYFN